eukprot:36970_1
MSTIESKILSIPPVICGFISFIACIYVCISAIRNGYIPCKPLKKKLPKSMSWQALQQKLKRQSSKETTSNIEFGAPLHNHKSTKYSDSNHPTMMVDILFWMCVCDGLHAIQIICNWFPLAFNLPFWDMTGCYILGISAQFLAIQSPCWHVLLAYNLGYLLLDGSINKLSKQKKYQFIIVNIIPFICTILPFIYNEYGKYQNNITYNDIECWITSEKWQYMYVIAICLSLMLHYIVIIIAISKWKSYSESGFDYHFKFIIIKLLRFIVIYTIIRFFPVLNRIWEFASPNPPPFVLIAAHHIGVSLLGLSDAVVWCINQKQIPYQKTNSFTNLKNAKKRHHKLKTKRLKATGNTCVQNSGGSYQNSDELDTADIETTTTDYWISTKVTPHVTPQGNINANFNIIHQHLHQSNANNTLDSRKSPYPDFDITTPEMDIESQCIWSLDE